MAALSEGDIVVLVSGSPRFVVESIQSTKVSCVWCNEGQIHRDTFDMSIVGLTYTFEFDHTAGHAGLIWSSTDIVTNTSEINNLHPKQ